MGGQATHWYRESTVLPRVPVIQSSARILRETLDLRSEWEEGFVQLKGSRHASERWSTVKRLAVVSVASTALLGLQHAVQLKGRSPLGEQNGQTSLKTN